ncbi:hypothetical protein [Pelagicoccus sp. SDUM812003]|uniref:sodium:solute symporter family transporter n=1 Tax=Pelagicoccus sp. SDUM812003 TaxID=3041267 RepID=UPI00280F7859|nr:hypothetical protein [Pelagicoccus sp. SDUM812003]MDQ8204901.1 hypothetical protein [Pelagicoccus sp. SDUM812003]
MSVLDYSILVAYLVGLLSCGVYLSRQASKDSEAYFLGGRKLPWWALGASGMTSNLDAAGTMTIVTLLYLFGAHGFFIEMRGGVVLPIAVFLAFMGKWHQRSQVVTTAEWMNLRFGQGFGGRSARFLAALTYLVITIGMVVFFLAAAGKFLAVFLPFSPEACSIGMAIVALVYTLMSGLFGVVWTDVFQGGLIAAAAIYISVRAGLLVDVDLLANWEGARYNTALPRWSDQGLGEYSFFGAFLLAWMAKGIVEGLGGSGGSAYMAQRFYAARSAAECEKIGMLWTILFAFRWPMAIGIAIIGIHLGIGNEDPERVLPQVLTSDFFPSGIRGIVIAALFAASMSTFDSTINAGASYVVRDIFVPLRRNATERAQVLCGYAASVGIVAIGLTLAMLVVDSVVDAWVTIVIQLFPAFLIPFMLRWFWGRFNGEGFSMGILFGFAASLTVAWSELAAGWNEVQVLAGIGGFSLVGCMIGTFFFSPVDQAVLQRFYETVRPNGIWPNEWKAEHRSELWKNWIRLAVALVWQISTFMLPMFLVLKQWTTAAGLTLLWLIAFWALKRLRDPEENTSSPKMMKG